jgi:hypothetical protein
MRSVFIVCGLVICASPASAQWDVTAFLGEAATSPGRLEIRSASSDTSVAVEPVRFGDESFASPWYYGARLTPRLNLGNAVIYWPIASRSADTLVEIVGRLRSVISRSSARRHADTSAAAIRCLSL